MKRDHQKISTCAIKGCKILVGKAVRKNASHIKVREKKNMQYANFILLLQI